MESYKEKYDRIVKPLSYEVKRELMVEPMEFPVSSAFNKKQMVEWLDSVKYWLESEGFVLTNTEEMFLRKIRITLTSQLGLVSPEVEHRRICFGRFLRLMAEFCQTMWL